MTALLILPGCLFRQLGQDLKEINQFALVDGRVSYAGAETGPVIVIIHNGSVVADSFVLTAPDAFYFAVPAGTYQLAVFENRSDDYHYNPGVDRVATSAPITVDGGEQLHGINLVIGEGPGTPPPFGIGSIAPGQRGVRELPDIQVGTVATLDDSRFTADKGDLGLWKPARFLFDVGAGVYFLEPYDPDKIPVLFVHGALGTPQNWRFLIEHLDRSRFQPWLAYYPSAVNLHSVAQALVRWLSVLHTRYDFSEMIVVAHSMGGLVARSAINQRPTKSEHSPFVNLPAFVTISTPWDGHAAAALGVQHAPVVAPAWKDLAPGSDFLHELTGPPLPEDCHYHLFFSYGGSERFSRAANDGTVTVASELPLRVQSQAKTMRGFDATHISILSDATVSAALNEILNEATEH